MKNPFYNHGKALKELGECLMDDNTKIDELSAKAHACGFSIHFTASQINKEAGKTKNNKRSTQQPKRRSVHAS
ncbi:MAG: hypothetical protein PHS93_09945 [Candidatus Omnitrophica bacterium]|nr:hypothetical protein [Candidatus Omnitrophota bacterium]MDD5353471.1 hypothetical protein [Candidatus Omnitrophota bacterium]